MRKRLWQFHSWLGLVAGLGLVVIGLTGSLLVFHDEIDVLLDPALVRVVPSPGGRLPATRLAASINHQLPGYEIAGWGIDHDDPAHADFLYIRRHGSAKWLVSSVNPYTGQILSSPHDGTSTFTGWLLELHYAFFGDHLGIFIVGLFGTLLCLLGVSGVWLYRCFWKHLFTLRWGRSTRILFSDIHKFIGITSVAFNLLLGFTGAWWNLSHIVEHWTTGGDDERPAPTVRLYSDTLDFDSILVDSTTRLPGFKVNYLDFPVEAGSPFTLYGQTPGSFLSGPYGSTVSYDAHTGEFRAASDLKQSGQWTRAVDAFTPLHYGTFGGLPVKILWSLGGLAPGLLAISGFLMWFHRRRRPPVPIKS
ncbi:MAG: PepSY-associated TM helix domain-containing protein [Opitutaceae bacterium]|jgi:uncharacterized iron-regulated membrane protein